MKLLDKFKEKYNRNEPYIARKDHHPFRVKLGGIMALGGIVLLFAVGMLKVETSQKLLPALVIMVIIIAGMAVISISSLKTKFYVDIVTKDNLVMYKLVIMRGSISNPFREEKVKQLFETFANAEAYYELGSDWDIEPE